MALNITFNWILEENEGGKPVMGSYQGNQETVGFVVLILGGALSL